LKISLLDIFRSAVGSGSHSAVGGGKDKDDGFFQFHGRLLFPDMDNLADVHIVDAKAGPLVPVPLFLRHQGSVKLLSINLLAFDGQVRFRIDGIAQFREFNGQSGSRHLVFIPT
jgi:hypothetical protein